MRRSCTRRDDLYVADLADTTRAIREYLDSISRAQWDEDRRGLPRLTGHCRHEDTEKPTRPVAAAASCTGAPGRAALPAEVDREALESVGEQSYGLAR